MPDEQDQKQEESTDEQQEENENVDAFLKDFRTEDGTVDALKLARSAKKIAANLTKQQQETAQLKKEHEAAVKAAKAYHALDALAQKHPEMRAAFEKARQAELGLGQDTGGKQVDEQSQVDEIQEQQDAIRKAVDAGEISETAAKSSLKALEVAKKAAAKVDAMEAKLAQAQQAENKKLVDAEMRDFQRDNPDLFDKKGNPKDEAFGEKFNEYYHNSAYNTVPLEDIKKLVKADLGWNEKDEDTAQRRRQASANSQGGVSNLEGKKIEDMTLEETEDALLGLINRR